MKFVVAILLLSAVVLTAAFPHIDVNTVIELEYALTGEMESPKAAREVSAPVDTKEDPKGVSAQVMPEVNQSNPAFTLRDTKEMEKRLENIPFEKKKPQKDE